MVSDSRERKNVGSQVADQAPVRAPARAQTIVRDERSQAPDARRAHPPDQCGTVEGVRPGCYPAARPHARRSTPNEEVAIRVTLVHVHVKPEHVEEFIAATRLNHIGSVQEPGNLRFDVLQQEDDPTRFVLFEIFRDDAAIEAHRLTNHYRTWRDAVQGWMAADRIPMRYRMREPRLVGS